MACHTDPLANFHDPAHISLLVRAMTDGDSGLPISRSHTVSLRATIASDSFASSIASQRRDRRQRSTKTGRPSSIGSHLLNDSLTL